MLAVGLSKKNAPALLHDAAEVNNTFNLYQTLKIILRLREKEKIDVNKKFENKKLLTC